MPFCSLAFPLTLVLPSSSLCGASRFSWECIESNRGLHECVVFLEHLRGVEFIKELKEPSISGLCFSIEADLDVNHCMLSVIDWIQLAALDVDSLDFEDNPSDDISCSQGEAFSCRQIGSCIDRMCLTLLPPLVELRSEEG
ncbi:hypothetical protein YC2023_082573 [Brassica napus]